MNRLYLLWCARGGMVAPRACATALELGVTSSSRSNLWETPRGIEPKPMRLSGAFWAKQR